MSFNLTNVTWSYTGQRYAYIGNFVNRTDGNPRYNFDRVNIEGEVDANFWRMFL